MTVLSSILIDNYRFMLIACYICTVFLLTYSTAAHFICHIWILICPYCNYILMYIVHHICIFYSCILVCFHSSILIDWLSHPLCTFIIGSILIGVRAAFTRLAVAHSSIPFAVHSFILISYQAILQMAVDVQF
jgi:hypothetical protein